MREDLTDCAREVDIMLRLDHPGVVSCYPTPPGLDPGTRELPTLTMEFCQEGDLRSQSSTAEISVLHSHWPSSTEAPIKNQLVASKAPSLVLLYQSCSHKDTVSSGIRPGLYHKDLSLAQFY